MKSTRSARRLSAPREPSSSADERSRGYESPGAGEAHRPLAGPLGVIPATWLETRAIGEATLTGVYADVGHARSLTYLRTAMAGRLIHYDILDLDAAAIRLSAPRRFTQEISNHIYKLSAPDRAPRFVGIEYQSRFGDNYQNWAIFERPGQQPIIDPIVRPVRRDDPSLHAALTVLALKLAER